MEDEEFGQIKQEIIQEEGKVPVIVIAPYAPAFPDVIRVLAVDPLVQLVECGSSLEAVAIARQFDRCVLLFHGPEFRDVIKHATMLKLLQDGVKEERIRAIFTSYIEQNSVLSKLTYYGCKDIVKEPVVEKSLLFKVNRHILALSKLNLVQEIESDTFGRFVAKGSSPRLDSEKTSPMFRLVPPLEIESDFWFLPSGPPRTVGGRWVVRVKGPVPSIGTWESDGEEDRWIWKPLNRMRHPFIQKGGVWYFRGQKPLFKKEFWWFVGAKPELVFHENGKQMGAKIYMDNFGILVLSKNSDASSRAVPLFQVQASKVSSLSREQDKTVRRGKSSQNYENKRREDHEFKLIEPLTILSDFWGLEERRPKWVNEHWMLRFKGPHSSYGHWVEIPKGSASEKLWRWVSHYPDRDPYIQEPGTWEFMGFQPKFDKDSWIFVSKRPLLTFVDNGDYKVLATRVHTDPGGVVLVAEDSLAAKKALQGAADPTQSVVKKPAAAKGGQTVFRLDASQFGNPPGKWRKVAESKSGRQKFIYIPFEHINELPNAIPLSKQKETWVYIGMAPPEFVSEGKKQWVFRGWTPQKVQKFSSLDADVQKYITRIENAQVADSPEERKKALARYKQNFRLKIEIEKPKIPDLDLDISQPKLSPLALSLLIAELVCRPQSEAKEIARYFCKFVSGSFDGVRTELWVCSAGKWVCVNTVDGTDGQYAASFGSVEFFPQVTQHGTLVAPIVTSEPEEVIVGAVVFGGKGVERVSVDSAQGYSMMAKGVVQAFF